MPGFRVRVQVCGGTAAPPKGVTAGAGSGLGPSPPAKARGGWSSQAGAGLTRHCLLLAPFPREDEPESPGGDSLGGEISTCA